MLSIVVDVDNKKDGFIVIKDTNDIKHITNVYRLNIGDDIRVVDGYKEYLTKISKISKKEILVEIISEKEDSYSLDVDIDIAIGIIKNDKMKLLIQKLTEIGVNKIIPLKTQRVIVKINDKKENWENTVTEAMKQCRAVKKLKVDNILSLKDIDFSYYDKLLFLYEKSQELDKIQDIVTKKDKKILCVIGPEGGLTQEEVEYMKKNNFKEISLGKRIQRAETACISVASILAHTFGY